MSTRGKGFWAIVVIVLLAAPFLFFGSVIAYWVLARARMADTQTQAERAAVMRAMSAEMLRLKEQEALARKRAEQAEVTASLPGAVGMSAPAPPRVEEQVGRRELQSHVVLITANFEGLGTAFCEGLIVDRTTSGAVVVVAPASVFVPKTGKINGRVVTRKAGPITLTPSIVMDGSVSSGALGPGGMGGMPPGMGMGAGMGGGGSGSLGGSVQASPLKEPRVLAGTGLVAFTFDATLPPLQLLGDIPQVAVGDKVRYIGHNSQDDSLPPPGFADDARVSVVGVDEQFSGDGDAVAKAPWKNLIRLSEGKSPLGALVVNERNQPVAMVVAIRPVGDGNKQEAFAAPIEQVFRASLPFLEGQADIVAEVSPADTSRATPEDADEKRMDSLSRELAQRIRMATDDKKPDLLAELGKLLDQHFDHRQQRRQAEIDEVGARLEMLRESHQKRQTDKTDILKRRLEDLTDPKAERPWDEPK